MNDSLKMKGKEFEKLLYCVKICYSKDFNNSLPKLEDFHNGSLIDSSNSLHRSVALRIEVINALRKSRDDGSKLDINQIWKNISESINIIPKNATICSVGSQGFLSIPLFKYDQNMKEFEFIRLHIWDESIDNYINIQARDNFSIHNHSFHADSWILCGNVINDRFSVVDSGAKTDYAFFKISYNDTINEVNQHTSIAERTDQFAKAIQISHELYFHGSTYNIQSREFHKSGFEKKAGIAATLFSFTSKNDYQGPSAVLGPSSIDSSKINRKAFIDPTNLISMIDKKFEEYE